MEFKIIGQISEIETIAKGREIRSLVRLRKFYATGKWKKKKGIATVRLMDGTIRRAEVHWYEAHGIGKKEIKIKLPFLD